MFKTSEQILSHECMPALGIAPTPGYSWQKSDHYAAWVLVIWTGYEDNEVTCYWKVYMLAESIMIAVQSGWQHMDTVSDQISVTSQVWMQHAAEVRSFIRSAHKMWRHPASSGSHSQSYLSGSCGSHGGQVLVLHEWMMIAHGAQRKDDLKHPDSIPDNWDSCWCNVNMLVPWSDPNIWITCPDNDNV